MHLRGLDVAGECFAGVDGVHGQAAAGKFALRLSQQVDPIDDEIEFGDDAAVSGNSRSESGRCNRPARFCRCPGCAR